MGSGSWSSDFLILVVDADSGLKSATAAAMTMASAEGCSASNASRIPAAVGAGITRAPAGTGTSTVPTTAVTSAPRARARSTIAKPCRPLERLPRKRTGSRSSRVPPTDTTRCLPARSRAGGSRASSTSRARSSGSGSRPAPESAPVSRPTAGSTICTPLLRRVATLARVAGCSHISVCIAGAMRTGPVVVSREAVSRSSDMPAAARARRFALAGATTTMSAQRPRLTWGTAGTSDHTESLTG